MIDEQWDRIKLDALELHGLSERSKILGGYKLVISSEDEDEEYPMQYIVRSSRRIRGKGDIELASKCLLSCISAVKQAMLIGPVPAPHLYSHQDYDFHLTYVTSVPETPIIVVWIGAIAPEPSPAQKRMTNLARAKLGAHETRIPRNNNAGYRQTLSGDSRS